MGIGAFNAVRAALYHEIGGHTRIAMRPDDDMKLGKLIKQGQVVNEAEALLKSYVATVPNNSDLPPHSVALEWLGKLYESQGRFSEAAEEFRMSLSLDPHNKTVEEELRRVQKK